MPLPPSEIARQQANIQDDRRGDIIAASAVCLTFATAAVILRFVARRISRASIRSDDFMIVAGLIFTAAFVAGVDIGVHFGTGRHAILISNPRSWGMNNIATEVLYNPAICGTKFSILLLYRRLFPGRKFNNVLIAVGVFVLCYSITAIFVNIFQCVPVRANWDPTVTPHCVNLAAELIAIGVINVVTDIVILCLPIPFIWRLHIAKNKKIQLTLLFLAGSFVCITSIVRAAYLAQISLLDGSWGDVDGAIWSIVELCSAIVCACLPTLKPVFDVFFHGTPKSTQPANHAKPGSGATGDEIKNRLWQKGKSNRESNDSRSFAALEDMEMERLR